MSNIAKMGLTSAAPTLRQRRLAYAAMALMVVAYGAMVPFIAVPWLRMDSFVPTVGSMGSLAEFGTAVLLFSQFSVSRSRELLVLASGYLFSALGTILHFLTFPGAWGPVDFGANIHSASWIYFFWHVGFSVAVIGYVYLKAGSHAGRPIQRSTRSAIGWSVLLVIALACGLGWLVTTGKELLPTISLFASETTLAPGAKYMAGLNLSITLLALGLIWIHRTSVLDEWLMVALMALVAELALVAFFLGERFTVGYYLGRFFFVVSSSIVLAALLAEMAGLYAKLSTTLTSLQRERESKLLSLQAIGSAIAHEVNQPIAAIALEGSTALKFLTAPPNVEEARISLNAIVDEAFRASDVLKTIRDLFKGENSEMETVDGNAIVVEALHLLRDDLKAHHIIARTELTSDLPHITGHKGQLLQVMLNLLHNAVEALDRVKDRTRVVRIETSRHGHDKTSITVEDSGPGISPQMISKVFDTFITSKSTGMGMGLSLCRMIVERHGGDIVASSSGSGARFQVILPASKSVGATSA